MPMCVCSEIAGYWICNFIINFIAMFIFGSRIETLPILFISPQEANYFPKFAVTMCFSAIIVGAISTLFEMSGKSYFVEKFLHYLFYAKLRKFGLSVGVFKCLTMIARIGSMYLLLLILHYF